MCSQKRPTRAPKSGRVRGPRRPIHPPQSGRMDRESKRSPCKATMYQRLPHKVHLGGRLPPSSVHPSVPSRRWLSDHCVLLLLEGDPLPSPLRHPRVGAELDREPRLRPQLQLAR